MIGDNLTIQTAYPLISSALEKTGIMDIKNFNDLPTMAWIQSNGWEMITNSFYLLVLIITAIVASVRRQNARAGLQNYPLEDIRIE